MNEELTTIYLVQVRLNSQRMVNDITPVEVRETKKMYMSTGRERNRNIPKESLMKIKTNIKDVHYVYMYYTYCLDGYQEEALDMLKEKILNRFTNVKSEVEACERALEEYLKHH